MKRYWKFIIALLVAGALAASIGLYLFFKPQSKKTTADPDFKMTAAALYKAYDQNHDSASKVYNGKIVQVTGEVASIGKDKGGNTNVGLIANPDDMFGVTGEFAPEAAGDLKSVKKGDHISFEGDVSGKLDLGDVVISHATLVKE